MAGGRQPRAAGERWPARGADLAPVRYGSFRSLSRLLSGHVLIFAFSQVERHSTSQVLFVWAQTLSVSCSSGTWRISYLQCTLPRPLLRFFLLLSNGRRLGGGPLSRGLAQDGYQSSLEPRSHMYSSISTLAKLYVMVPGDGRRVAGTLQNHIGDRTLEFTIISLLDARAHSLFHNPRTSQHSRTDVVPRLQCPRLETHPRHVGRPCRHRQAQPCEAVRSHAIFANSGLQAELLNRRNTFTTPAGQDLVDAYELFDRDDRVRAIVLTADHTAPAFCSGVRLFCPLLK
jgi:hypothetical protein